VPESDPAVEGAVSKARHRVSREELYEDLNDGMALTPTFLALAGLSAIVVSIGLIRSDLVAIIRAMVLAPLLCPHRALA
jgi:uncharacterized membrane protein